MAQATFDLPGHREIVEVGTWRYWELIGGGHTPVIGPALPLPDPYPQYATDLELAQATPRAASWPIWVYGASYATHGQAYHTAGKHWTQELAARAGAGTVTSYGVNGRRALGVTLALLNEQPMSGITGIVAGAKFPGTATRNGLIVFDQLGNDAFNQAAMNAASITVQAITGTTYLNYLKQTYRAALALASSGSRIENHSHTATGGTGWSHSAAGSWGDTCFTVTPGDWAEYSVKPAQRGPLAGKVHIILDGDIATGSTYADVTVSVDGGAASAPITTHRVTYVGHNGTTVKGVVNAIPVTVPVDGANHTVRVTHAGTSGQMLAVDTVTVPSEDPNPILCMGIEHPLKVHAAGLDATDLNLYAGNTTKVCAAYREVVAEFGNAIYVPSTATLNGVWSGDGVHLNDRGNEQRAGDAWAAVSGIKARLDSRVLAQAPDSDFGVV